jgi:hypothetical protein
MFNESTNLWLSEPPQWPLICGELASSSHNLKQYLRCDKEVDKQLFGSLFSIDQFMLYCQSIESELESGREIESIEAGKESGKCNEIKELS